MKKMVLFLLMGAQFLFANGKYDHSVVKIFNTVQSYDQDAPWSKKSELMWSGSGFILDGSLIMTCAHVISNSDYVEVKFPYGSKKWEAHVISVSHEYDIALLYVQDDDFKNLARPLSFAQESAIGDTVRAIGFPMGGDELCITKGTITREDTDYYAQSFLPFPVTQVDCAINPGNSGGPIISDDDKVVGMAHQGWIIFQNLSYMVPTCVIRNFLDQTIHGGFKGFPFLCAEFQDIENDAMRKYLDLGPFDTGILVTYVSPNSYLSGYLRGGDILVKMDDYYCDSKKMLVSEDGEYKSIDRFLMDKLVGDKVLFTVMRNGKVLKFDIELQPIPEFEMFLKGYYETQVPSYYVFGGCVFEPYYFYSRFTTDEEMKKKFSIDQITPFKESVEDLVIFSRVLNHPLNRGYASLVGNAVYAVNGQEINTMRELINAFKEPEGEFHVIQFYSGEIMVLEKELVDQYNGEILAEYGVPKERSDDLLSVPSSLID